MSNQKPPSSQRNRPTDPFGGPRRGARSTVSTGVVVIALAIIVFIQWRGGDLGGLTNTPAAQTGVSATLDNSPPATEDAATVGTQATPADLRLSPTPDATADVTAGATSVGRSTVAPTHQANAPPSGSAGNLPVVAYADLPPEAHATIRLIEQDGPFPYRQDGATFQNRERLLPRHPEGYYREYTVETPGASNRGARRIVTGSSGEMYYTDDHYDSFREIAR